MLITAEAKGPEMYVEFPECGEEGVGSGVA